MKHRFCINDLSKYKVERLVYFSFEESLIKAKDAAGEMIATLAEGAAGGMEITVSVFSGLTDGAKSGIEWLKDAVHEDPTPHKDGLETTTSLSDPQPRDQETIQDLVGVIEDWGTRYTQDVESVDEVYKPFKKAWDILEKMQNENVTKLTANKNRIAELNHEKDVLRAQYGAHFQRMELLQKQYDDTPALLATQYKTMAMRQLQWNDAKAHGDTRTMQACERAFNNAQNEIIRIKNAAKFAYAELNKPSKESSDRKAIEVQIKNLEKENLALAGTTVSFSTPEIAKLGLISLLLSKKKINAAQAATLQKDKGSIYKFMSILAPYLDALEDEREKLQDQVKHCADKVKWLEGLEITD